VASRGLPLSVTREDPEQGFNLQFASQTLRHVALNAKGNAK
jgi:hypothetical protein